MVGMVGIQEDIFEEFFRKLREDAEFPNKVVEELRKLWESHEIASKEKLFNILKRGIEDAGKNQGH